MSELVIFKSSDAASMVGFRFGSVVPVSISPRHDRRDAWLCLCDCGVQKVILGKSLRRGLTKSCGCGIKKAIINRCTTHGLSKHPLHGVLKNIRDRCSNPNNKDYHSYGGRGVKCCFSGLQEFVEWAIGAGWKPGLTIDRIDNDGSYCVSNCRIATRHAQARNTRRNRFVFVKGRQLCFTDAAAELGIVYSVAMERLKKGMSPEESLGLDVCQTL